MYILVNKTFHAYLKCGKRNPQQEKCPQFAKSSSTRDKNVLLNVDNLSNPQSTSLVVTPKVLSIRAFIPCTLAIQVYRQA